MKDTSLLDKIIVGRVEPHIYAFSTNTIPNYLKVGDTYRPVSIRLNEWKLLYPNLKKEYEKTALVDKDTFFRDYAVHQYLENKIHKKRINPNDFPELLYVSNEFFEDTSPSDIESAISDIKSSFKNNLMKYKFYSANTSLRIIEEYESTGYWNPRPNQKEVIENFKQALEKGRNNLLMYAVMRFGKSFTSMCCAVEMNAKIVVIVSAKADVKEEWKKTIQSADNFKDYKFITSYELNEQGIINKILSSGKNVALFLTLQDLQGDNIKEKHIDLFKHKIDLLLIDETHFGARAEKYGAVLRNLPKDVADSREDNFADYDEANEIVKILDSRVKIHLSGTPYRILMGSEFEKEDIIAFCQFPDIVKAQEEWDAEFLAKEEYNEWDNPYYGFPQMIRFAFNPNDSVRKKLEELKKKGISYAFSELLKPNSIQKTSDGQHKIFKYEQEVLDLLEVIDGSKDDAEVLGFLDYPKIKEGNMCRHIVMVLPYCASCDCIENLISANKAKFKNLNEYEIINISGVDKSTEYKRVQDIKNKIKECEKNNIKTLTLTVNRMLTGSTVEEWDTMIYLKDTSSPQEYDQSIFRLQNQFIQKYIAEDGEEIQYNKKPQTLLVDFDPNRMFTMQENKSLIYNVNVDKSGNSKLQERLENELRISPIIVFNKDKIKQITATDIMEYVSNYSNSKGVLDEANEIPVDMTLLNIEEIRNTIIKQAQIGTKSGLKIKNTEDEPDDHDFEQLNFDFNELNNFLESGKFNNTNQSDKLELAEEINYNNIIRVLTRKFKTYYARLLFFAFLTNDKVNSLESILKVIDNAKNNRIAINLGLDKSILSLILDNIDPFKLSQLDYKIQNINLLSNDNSMNKIDRAMVAVNKFDKLSLSEIVTPQNICNSMIEQIDKDYLINTVENNGKILDIASKEGEFTLALYKKLIENGVESKYIKNALYAIPTSTVAYEFTRKIYEILDLKIENISKKFNSYDMLEIKNSKNNVDYNRLKKLLFQNCNFDEIDLHSEEIKEMNGMRFDVIVGNPPYQENIGGKVNQSLGKQLYPSFIQIAIKLNPNYISMITPSRWFTGNAQDRSFTNLRKFIKNNNHFKKIFNYYNNKQIFPNESIGSVNYFLYDPKYNGDVEFNEIDINGNIISSSRPLFEEGIDIILPMNIMVNILHKVSKRKDFMSMEKIASARNPFGVPQNDSDLEKKCSKQLDKLHSVKILCSHEQIRYISEKEITRNHNLVNHWKVFTSKMNGGAGTLLDSDRAKILGKTHVYGPNSICSNALLAIGNFDNEIEANNLNKYMNSKFFRFMLGIKKSSQVLTSNVYSYVPIQDFTDKSDIDWNNEIKFIDEQLYKKYNLSEIEINFIESKIKIME
ncbi:MAG TPA: Eco57I restriction-modification methylase domain-containing protein [Candidatus Faecisoma merdavium]|nr:Eco57I restriction-modification methylase domain-containing protein [Candidatus Faecisoma merdavium]